MEPRIKMAAIGLSVLQWLGLRSVARGMGMIAVELYGGYDDFQSDADRFDLYAVSSDEFVSNIDYFMPKRQRVLVVSGSAGHREAHDCSGTVYADSDEETIASNLERMARTLDEARRSVTGTLSQRETEVLRHIAGGLTNKEIADALCISANTVITHRKNISAKLGIRSVSGLSLYAMMNGLV